MERLNLKINLWLIAPKDGTQVNQIDPNSNNNNNNNNDNDNCNY